MSHLYKFRRAAASLGASLIALCLFIAPMTTASAADTSSKSSGTEASETTGANTDASSAEAETLAVEWPEGPTISSPSACVMEVNTGTVLYEKNDHEKHYPASITKILTTILALENDDLDDIVTFGKTAVYENEGSTSNIARDLGEEMTVEQTLYAVMLESANECAYQIAEFTGEKMGGDLNTFIDAMNERAEELGCTDTHFNNPNGLPDKEHYTSAYDYCLISCAAYQNEEFRTITGTKTYTIPPTNKHSDSTFLNNHHKLLHKYRDGNYVNPYCTGGKTGYTTAANSTLVTYAEKDGITLCVVIMDADDPDHFVDTNTLLDYCFSHFQKYEISDSDSSLQLGSSKDYGFLNENRGFVTLDSDSYVILPKNASFSDVKIEQTEGNQTDTLAELKYTYDGHVVGNAKIVSNNETIITDSVFGNGVTASYDTENDSEMADAVSSSDHRVIIVTPLAIAAIVTGLLLVILITLLIIHLIRVIRRKQKEKAEAEANLDWRADKKRRKRMMKARRQKEKQRRKAEKKQQTAKPESPDDAAKEAYAADEADDADDADDADKWAEDLTENADEWADNPTENGTVTAKKAVIAEKTVTAEKAVTADKTVTVKKAVTAEKTVTEDDPVAADNRIPADSTASANETADDEIVNPEDFSELEAILEKLDENAASDKDNK